MYYLAHLAFPALVAIVLAVDDIEISLAWFERASVSFGSMYILFALPHFIWASATSYFEVSKTTTIAGFAGAHLLLVTVTILVATSSSREAANGWLLFWFGSPIAIALGALIGGWVWRRASSTT